MGSDESHFNVSVGSDGQSHKTVSTKPQPFWRERRAEAVSNWGPSAYQPNALPPNRLTARLVTTGHIYSLQVMATISHWPTRLAVRTRPSRWQWVVVTNGLPIGSDRQRLVSNMQIMISKSLLLQVNNYTLKSTGLRTQRLQELAESYSSSSSSLMFQDCPQTSSLISPWYNAQWLTGRKIPSLIRWYWWIWLSAACPFWSSWAFLKAWVLGASAVSVLSCIGPEHAELGFVGLSHWACSWLCVKNRGDTGGMHAEGSIASPQWAVVQTETVGSCHKYHFCRDRFFQYTGPVIWNLFSSHCTSTSPVMHGLICSVQNLR